MQFLTGCASASCACYKAKRHEHETGNIRPATSCVESAHKVAVQEVTVQQVIVKVAVMEILSNSHYPSKKAKHFPLCAVFFATTCLQVHAKMF